MFRKWYPQAFPLNFLAFKVKLPPVSKGKIKNPSGIRGSGFFIPVNDRIAG